MSTDDKTRIVSTSEGVGPGTQLNGIFEIDEHIAFGGMGEVYRGHNIQTDDPVAIKIVLPEFARDKTMLALFRKEASILSHLANDAIVRYHVFTIDPAIGRPYLAMEYVDGVSLADMITRGPLSAEKVARLVKRIASGLSAAHAAGVIHRDLSPDNVILPGGKVNKAKIIDFGIAKSATGGGTLLGGKFAGKYNFVSPEQLGDFGGEITGRSDIYSLGLVMAAALRGEALDMGGSQVEVIEKRRRMPDVSNLDPTLRPILEAMLQPDPDMRPPDMDAVVEWMSAAAQALGDEEAEAAASKVVYSPGERSTPPSTGSAPPTVLARALPPASVPPLATGSYPHEASVPPAHSIPPTPSVPPSRSVPPASARSMPPLPGTSLPPRPQASVPPLPQRPLSPTGSAAPVSESPFGPGPAAAPAWTPPAAQPAIAPAQARPSSRAGLYAAAAVVLIALAAGGAYMGGLFGPATQETASNAPPAALTPAKPAETPAAPAADPAAASAPAAPAEPAAPAAGEQTAVVVPPTQPPAADAVDPIDTAATRVEWLRDYDGGACFYAAATNVSDDTVAIEGFGTSAAPFETMLTKFKESHKVEPDIGVRVIEPKQCAVADFLRALRESNAPRPTLALSSDIIKSGQALRGTLDNLEGRKTDILLVDNVGVVYNLASHLKQQENEQASFNIKLGLVTETPVPQMIIAVTSPAGLDSADVKNPVLAETLFPKILEEINSKKIDASAAAKYFKLGG